MPTTLPRVTITMDAELFEKVKDFQFSNRLNNQTQAITRLINMGLVSVGLMDEVKEKHTKKEAWLLDNYSAAPAHIKRLVDFALDPKQIDDESSEFRKQIDRQTKKSSSEDA